MAKILVADDNSNIQKMVGLALKDQGIDVVAVGNGEAAVRKISDVHPDLVLADVFMPVRNGYEVCRYVKEDSALSHIPVILLVGAFDPLDEQEAQRVGADGVLKKPFVPPDPLISMVKSALTRAGVALGPAPSAEKEKPAAPTRTGADILSGGVAPKLPALASEKLPEASPEPIEEFPAPPAQVKIPEGQGPLAFGNLLDSTETEEAVFSSKPMINIAGEKWDEETKDVPEEEEEADEELTHGWRPGGMDDEIEHAASDSKSVPDWRDEAFHGSSPAKNQPGPHWTPTAEKTELVEAAETQVAVSTLETKPVNGTSPFAGDAWAAALAAGVEKKFAEPEEKLPEAAPEPEPVAPATIAETASQEFTKFIPAPPEASSAEPAPAVEEPKAAEPGNWAPVPEASWEAEAKRASMLASTWDARPAPSPDETQEVPAYTSEQHQIEHEAPSEDAAPSAYSGHFEVEHESTPAAEAPAQETAEEAVGEGSLPKSWENAWEAPASVSAPPEVVHQTQPEPEVQQVVEHAISEVPADHHVSAPAPEPVAQAEPAPEAPLVQASEPPNMDELVARVLGKMNPEVLQRVTHEILKPVIEAIVRDELNSRK